MENSSAMTLTRYALFPPSYWFLGCPFSSLNHFQTGELGLGEFTALLKSRIPMDEAGYKRLFDQIDADHSGSGGFGRRLFGGFSHIFVYICM